MISNKNTTFSILIPPFSNSNISMKSLSSDKCRSFGYQGENLRFWLVAETRKSTIDLNDWDRNNFICEVTNVKSTNDCTTFSYVSTIQINQEVDERKTEKGERNTVMVPLEIQLPNKPGTADIIIWKSDYTSKVITWSINIELPLKFTCTFGTCDDKMSFNFEFLDCIFDINEFDLHFTPTSNISLSMLEDAFILQKALDKEYCYYLSFRSNTGLKLLNKMKLSLVIIWGNSSMLSSYDLNIPFPSGPLGLIWSFPTLKRLKQTSISLELTNISNNVIYGKVELEETCLIPLEKSICFNNLKPNEKRTLTFPCIPRTCGTFVLNYIVEINQEKFKPLFQTIIVIE